MKNNLRNTAENTQECFEEEHFIVARIKCKTEKGLLAECLLSILQRAMTLKGRWEYCIPITGNSSLLTVPSAFAIAVFSRTTWSLLLIWPVYFQVIPLFMAAFEALGTQIYTALSNPGMYITSMNLLLNGKFLR